jgi:hypothetical protein
MRLARAALLVVALAGATRAQAQTEPPAPSPELLAPRARSSAPSSIHPPVLLLDRDGVAVVRSGQPIAARSCGSAGSCHDVSWIQAHSYHADLGRSDPRGKAKSGRAWDTGSGLSRRWDAIDYDHAPSEAGGAPMARSLAARSVEDNCVLCHARLASNQARLDELDAGRPEWALTATLIDTQIVRREDGRLVYDESTFDAEGRVSADRLGLGRPEPRACGFCHGLVHEGPRALALPDLGPHNRSTETQGVVFSAERIVDSALDVAGKESLARPWDVHAERMLSCSNCHFSPNHPAYSFAASADSPRHLKFDARRIEIDEYLLRPDHNFAKGSSAHRTAADHLDGTIRKCEACHDAPPTHAWLPRAERHFAALRCESCHVPGAMAPARSETDFTMLTSLGEARAVYRAMRGERLDGFRPLLLPRRDPDGSSRLTPHNLVTTWFWVEDGPRGERPVPRAVLVGAFLPKNQHHPELIRALDGNRDGRLEDAELVLDTAAKIDAARARLVAHGAKNPRIHGEVQPFGIHHGVVGGRFATRDCETCHSRDSRITEPFTLSSRAPFGVMPVLVADANVSLTGMIERDAEGRLVLRPEPRTLALHVFGLSRNRTIDLLGALLLVGVFLGTMTHGAMRYVSAKRRKESA